MTEEQRQQAIERLKRMLKSFSDQRRMLNYQIAVIEQMIKEWEDVTDDRDS